MPKISSNDFDDFDIDDFLGIILMILILIFMIVRLTLDVLRPRHVLKKITSNDLMIFL